MAGDLNEMGDDGEGADAPEDQRRTAAATAPLNPAAQQIVDGVLQEVAASADEWVETLIGRVRTEVPEYGRATPELRESFRRGTHGLLLLSVSALRTGERLSEEHQTPLRQLGAERAAQGIDLPILLGSLRLSVAAGWVAIARHMASLQPSAAKDAAWSALGARLLLLLHDMASGMEAGYEARQSELLAGRERRQAEVLDDLFHGGFSTDAELVERAARVGLDLSGAFGLVLLASSEPVVQRQAVRLAARALQASQPELRWASRLSGPHPHVVALVPTAAWSSVGSVIRETVHAQRLVALVADPADSLIALHENYQRLARLLPLARRLYSGKVVPRSDLGVLGLLRDDPEEMVRFVRQVCGGLLDIDGASRQELTQTVAAFYEARHSIKMTARQLHRHERTVQYRLARVGQLTGRDVVAERGELELAFRLLPLISSS